MDFIEPCFGIGHNLSLICQMTSEDIKHQLIDTSAAPEGRPKWDEKSQAGMDGHSSRSAVPPPGRPVTGQRMETVLGCFTAGSVATCWAGTLLVQSHLTGMVHCWFTHVLLDWFTTGSVTTYKNGSQLVVTIYRVSPLVQSQPAGLLHHWFSHNLLSWFITGSVTTY